MKASDRHRDRSVFRAIVLAGVFVVAAALVASIGLDSLAGGLGQVIRHAPSMAIAASWLIGAVGFGLALTTMWSGQPTPIRHALTLCTGAAVGIVLVNVFGSVMLPTSPIMAWAPVVFGVSVVVFRARLLWMSLRRPAEGAEGSARGDLGPSVSWWALVWVLPLAVLAVAACWSPGMQWDSEFGGYDTLSYHLMLPREWLVLGRIAPLEHNVYSWLPSGMEGVFAQVGAMAGATPANPIGTGSGVPVHAAGFVHAGMTLFAAVGAALGVRGLCAQSPVDAPRNVPVRIRHAGALLAGGVVLATPWSVVTGSSAYNEMAVVLMAIGALLIVMSSGMCSLRRGVVLGLVCAAAVLAKPTAIFMVALPAAVVLVMRDRPSRSARTLAMAAAIGLIALLPWLGRNWAASGNPVFPYASAVFGDGHWSAEQHERWAAGHHADAGAIERVGLLVADVGDAESNEQARGYAHVQWAITPVIGLMAIGALVVWKNARRDGLALGAALVVQIVTWGVLTHLQSRFLLPTIAPMAIAIGLAALRVPRIGVPLGVIGAVAGQVVLVLIVLGERDARVPTWGSLGARSGASNIGLVATVELKNGTVRLPDAVLADEVPAYALPAMANQAASGGRLLMVGLATPVYYAGDVAYSTTWDVSPVRTAIEEAGGDVRAAIERLRTEHGFTHAVIDLAELARLERSGWGDPLVTERTGLAMIASSEVVLARPNAGWFLVRLGGGGVGR